MLCVFANLFYRDALIAEDGEETGVVPTQEATKDKLHDILFSLHLSLLTGRARGPSVGTVHAVSFSHDKFVKPELSLEFFNELSGICARPNKVTCRWLPGGHIWAMLTRQSNQTGAIISAVQSLQEQD